jgi:flagellar biogenesis protein FliO
MAILTLLEIAGPEPVGYGWALLKMVGALLIVCLLAYLALRLARRHLAGGGGNGAVRVIERCALSGRHSLWLVEVGGRCLLLGTSDAPGGPVCKLAELDAAQLPPRDPPPRGRSFWEILQRGRGTPGGR